MESGKLKVENGASRKFAWSVFLCLTFSIFNCQFSIAQTHDGHDHDAPAPRTGAAPTPTEDVPFFGEGSEAAASADTVKKKRPKKPLESYLFNDEERARLNLVWTVDPNTNHIEIGHIDTLQNDFQNQYIFMKKGVGSAYLGNQGAPSEYLSYFDRRHHRHHSFANAWDAYLRTPADMPFYNVKKPFTQLSYAWAGQKARQEEDFHAIHAQNISPSTGFNVDYRSLGTKGIYSWQATRDKTFSAGFQHTGKRYTIHAGYVHNSIYNRENGGIVRDDDIIIDINTYEMAANIPVLMSDPKNTIKSNSYFLSQSFGIPLRRVKEEHFSIAGHPAVFIGHVLEYNRWVRKYEDTYSGTLPSRQQSGDDQITSYYKNWYTEPAATHDSIFEGQFSNRLFVQVQPWNRNGVVGTIDGGIGVDVMRYYQFSPDNSQFLTGVKNTAEKRTYYYAYAGIDGHIKRYFDWAAKFEIHPFGDRIGDIKAEAEVEARVFAKGKPLSIWGKFLFTSYEPTYWENTFYTNHFRWNNDFGKQNETRFDVGLRIPHIGFEFAFSQSALWNKIYYGRDFLPAQNTGFVNLTGIYIREDLHIPIRSSALNFNHRVQVQWSSDQKVVPVPLVAAYLSYSFEFNVVRDVLRLQFGVDARYNTKYYAPGYNPGTAQFYNQREKELGDYVWADLFVNAKWKRMRILLKIEHLNDNWFGRNYFTVLHYPQNRRILKIGISWNFYD